MTKRNTQSNGVALTSRAHEDVPDFVHAEQAVAATISLGEAALILGIAKSTAFFLYQEGRFPVPVLRIGSRIRVVKVHIQQFLETGEPVTFESATSLPVAFEPTSKTLTGG